MLGEITIDVFILRIIDLIDITITFFTFSSKYSTAKEYEVENNKQFSNDTHDKMSCRYVNNQDRIGSLNHYLETKAEGFFFDKKMKIPSVFPLYLTPVNPIPTGQGRNQPLYERHVAKSGRNRVICAAGTY